MNYTLNFFNGIFKILNLTLDVVKKWSIFDLLNLNGSKNQIKYDLLQYLV